MVKTLHSIDELPIGSYFICMDGDGKITPYKMVARKDADGISPVEELRRFMRFYPNREIYLC